MATATHFTAFPLRLPATPYDRRPPTDSLPVSTRTRHGPRNLTAVRALGTDMLGDFGARDPFPAELESKFGEKVLGNVDTDHKILIPNLAALSLAQQRCEPVSPLQPPMSEDDATKLVKKVNFGFSSFGYCVDMMFDEITERDLSLVFVDFGMRLSGTTEILGISWSYVKKKKKPGKYV